MPDEVTVKSGWKTSEYWTTLGVQATSFLVAVGVITPGTSATVNADVQTAAAAVFGLVTAAYTISRTLHKSSVAQAKVDSKINEAFATQVALR